MTHGGLFQPLPFCDSVIILKTMHQNSNIKIFGVRLHRYVSKIVSHSWSRGRDKLSPFALRRSKNHRIQIESSRPMSNNSCLMEWWFSGVRESWWVFVQSAFKNLMSDQITYTGPYAQTLFTSPLILEFTVCHDRRLLIPLDPWPDCPFNIIFISL